MVTGRFTGLVRGLRGFSLATLFALPLATACGGDDDPCEDGGRQYGSGDVWTCSDGCNACSCQDGEITSTLVGCDSPPGPNAGKLSCHDEIWHSHGTTWSCADGCCTCDDGQTQAVASASCSESASACPAAISDSNDGYVCPDELEGKKCTYSFSCSSGDHPIELQCEAGYWLPSESSCDYPRDFCVSGAAWVNCVDGTWQNARLIDQDRCPQEAPEAGSICRNSSITGVPDCGYFCSGSEMWTVVRCAGGPPYVWTYDDACTSQ